MAIPVSRVYTLACIYVDVKIDWCNSKVNGTALDPKVQYAQFVSDNDIVLACKLIKLMQVASLPGM